MKVGTKAKRDYLERIVWCMYKYIYDKGSQYQYTKFILANTTCSFYEVFVTLSYTA